MVRFLIATLILFVANTVSAQWLHYSGAPGGGHYSALTQINQKNVKHLKQAWIYHTGDVGYGKNGEKPTTFEATPIFFRNKLIFCTPYNKIIAVNPATGKQIWQHDPKLSRTMAPAESSYICRGVTAWTDKKSTHEQCKYRIYEATIDARLIAVDADTGKLCTGFGHNGQVNFKKGVTAPLPLTKKQMLALDVPDSKSGVGFFKRATAGQGGMTSPPVIINGKIITGSAFDDNFLSLMPQGVVRAYNVRNGKLLWTWYPIPKNMRNKTGAGNVWTPMSVDPKHNLIFVATTSPSPDFFGGNRIKKIPFADSVVAINASTGKPVWHYQIVHHDIFDYDPPSQPTLTNITRHGKKYPVVIETTKMGMVFILHRYTGKPFYPVVERPVPQTDVPGEKTSATQPFPSLPKPFITTTITPNKAWGMFYFDKRWCRNKIKQYRSQGLFTPPSLKGTLEFPFIGGGMNWGSPSIDPHSHLMIINYSRLASIITLIPRKEALAAKYENTSSRVYGGRYAFHHTYFVSPLGLPCTPPPWGLIAAVDLETGKVKWKHPFGSVERFGIDSPEKWGSPNFAGSLVTGSNLIFIGATMDRKIRAFNTLTGKKLWTGKVPSMAAANPMTYKYKGKQYVVIAAGGGLGSKPDMQGDSLVAFALPSATK